MRSAKCEIGFISLALHSKGIVKCEISAYGTQLSLQANAIKNPLGSQLRAYRLAIKFPIGNALKYLSVRVLCYANKVKKLYFSNTTLSFRIPNSASLRSKPDE